MLLIYLLTLNIPAYFSERFTTHLERSLFYNEISYLVKNIYKILSYYCSVTHPNTSFTTLLQCHGALSTNPPLTIPYDLLLQIPSHPTNYYVVYGTISNAAMTTQENDMQIKSNYFYQITNTEIYS